MILVIATEGFKSKGEKETERKAEEGQRRAKKARALADGAPTGEPKPFDGRLGSDAYVFFVDAKNKYGWGNAPSRFNDCERASYVSGKDVLDSCVKATHVAVMREVSHSVSTYFSNGMYKGYFYLYEIETGRYLGGLEATGIDSGSTYGGPGSPEIDDAVGRVIQNIGGTALK